MAARVLALTTLNIASAVAAPTHHTAHHLQAAEREPTAFPPRDFAASLVDASIHNNKSLPYNYHGRHVEILSDPSNLFLPRCAHAGEKALAPHGEDVVFMHNGLAVTAQGYYGAFSDILTANRGVHEPAEERLFAAVLAQIDPSRAALMVELGSYWAYYSTWFSKALPLSHTIAVEANASNLEVGRRASPSSLTQTLFRLHTALTSSACTPHPPALRPTSTAVAPCVWNCQVGRTNARGVHALLSCAQAHEEAPRRAGRAHRHYALDALMGLSPPAEAPSASGEGYAL